jgi:phenylalanyl-tRNA synthetase beta chain
MEQGVAVANPLTPDESVLRRGLLPGMLRALAFNADRRQTDVRLFEVGHVFPPPDPARLARALAHSGETVIDEREVLGVAMSAVGDDAGQAAAAWYILADALGIEGVDVEASRAQGAADAPPGLHPTRSARLVVADGTPGTASALVGVMGEVDPAVIDAFGLDAERRRVGWLEVDLGML